MRTALPTMVRKAAPTNPRARGGTTTAPSAAERTQCKPALQSDFHPIVTPFRTEAWEHELRDAGLLDSYQDIVHGIREGFDLGVMPNIEYTYTPPNHKLSQTSPKFIDAYVKQECSAGRYTGPFARDCLEALIGPFCSSPLGLVPKPGSQDVYCLVQDLSFPRNDPDVSSVNSDINSDDFPCEWGTFAEVVILVMDVPPGTEAATLDVDAAFCRVPITPAQQNYFIVQLTTKSRTATHCCANAHTRPLGDL